MRDFTVDECKRRNKIIETITERFSKWGYSEVSTPIVEYYKTFNHKTQDLKEEEMYKFFDSRGRILVLRPDMTVPVARLVNTKLKDMKLPLKLFYNAEVFRVHESFEGKRNEYLDCGIELIGASGEKTDMNLSIDNQNKVIELINKKSLTSLREYLDDIEIRKEYKEFLNKFPWLFGGYEMIKKAKGLAFNEDMKKNIEYLENLYLNLQKLGYEKYLSVDISMVPRVNYYSGIIFKGYVKEIGSTVIRGGRYDNLLESFGKSIPAIGFSVDVNLLIDSCDYEEKVNSEKIILSKDNYLEELRKAINKTRNGEKIEIIYK